MARAARAKATDTSNALIPWDQELAAHAEVAKAAEANTGTGGQYFSFAAGTMSFASAAIPGNQVAAIVLDALHERTYYDQPYNSQNPTPPTCFAFARGDDPDMKPHQTVFDHKQAQNPQCKGCKWDAWGSAPIGKGKACKEIRRLAVVPCGELDANARFTPYKDLAKSIETASMGFMKIPVMSVANWANYVKYLSTDAIKRPPFAVFSRIWLVPDPKSQFKVNFAMLDKAPDATRLAIMARVEEAKTAIEQPYDLDAEEAAPAKPAAKRGRAKF